jgi:Fe-S-cluster containining protein
LDSIITKPGFSYGFRPSACSDCMGACCKGAGGNVWLSPDELAAIAKHLAISEFHFVDEYTFRVNNRLTIKERYDPVEGAVCSLFDESIGGCSVYESRPNQCRTFPFWKQLKDGGVDDEDCPGVIYPKPREP